MEYGEVVLDLRVRSTESPAGYSWSERSSFDPLSPPSGRLSPTMSSMRTSPPLSSLRTSPLLTVNSSAASPPMSMRTSPPLSTSSMGASPPPHFTNSPPTYLARSPPAFLGTSPPSFASSLGASPPPGAAPASPPPSPGSPPPARPFKAFPRDPLALGGADEAYLRFRERMLSRVRAAAPRPAVSRSVPVTTSAIEHSSPAPTPSASHKDAAYWERRRKNNEAAKRSRDARRAKEDEIAIRAAFLERENLRLRYELAAVRRETASLRQAAAMANPSSPPPLLLSATPQHLHHPYHHQSLGQLVVHH